MREGAGGASYLGRGAYPKAEVCIYRKALWHTFCLCKGWAKAGVGLGTPLAYAIIMPRVGHYQADLHLKHRAPARAKCKNHATRPSPPQVISSPLHKKGVAIALGKTYLKSTGNSARMRCKRQIQMARTKHNTVEAEADTQGETETETETEAQAEQVNHQDDTATSTPPEVDIDDEEAEYFPTEVKSQQYGIDCGVVNLPRRFFAGHVLDENGSLHFDGLHRRQWVGNIIQEMTRKNTTYDAAKLAASYLAYVMGPPRKSQGGGATLRFTAARAALDDYMAEQNALLASTGHNELKDRRVAWAEGKGAKDANEASVARFMSHDKFKARIDAKVAEIRAKRKAALEAKAAEAKLGKVETNLAELF